MSAFAEKYTIDYYWLKNQRNNNFDLIRVLAALLVLLSHAYPLTGNQEIFKNIIGYANGGSLAVSVFFSISGFLVTRSLLRSDISSFFKARVLRIFPALFFVILFDALIIGPVFTKYPLNEYFHGWAFYAHLKTFFLFSFNTSLPGVFEDLPYPIWVNGSLWSLPYEFFLYLIIPIFGIFGILSKRLNVILLLAAVAGYFLIKNEYFGLSYANQGDQFFGALYPYLFFEYSAFFLIGSSLWIYREKVPLHFAGVLILLILACGGFKYEIGFIPYLLLIPYATIYFAIRFVKIVDFEKVGDLSYGIYLYAFPIQQSIVSIYSGDITVLKLNIITIPVTIFLAYFSYNLVEKKFLKYK